jgi:hypothetical protein
MQDRLTVDMCVGIRADCPVTYQVTADKQAEFSFGGSRDGFHYAFDAPALRTFLRVGTQALAELESPTGAVSPSVT